MKKIENLIFLIIVSGLLLLSCQPKIPKSGNGLTIPIREENFVKDTTKLSDLIEVVGIIPLETNEKGLIGRIDKVLFSKSRIFVLDRNKAKSVFIFNRNGKFINRITANGKGPMDILNPDDIAIQPVNGKLLILDQSMKKFNAYNENGSYEGTTSLGFYAHCFEFIGTSRIAFGGQQPFLLIITDLKGKVLINNFEYEPDFQMSMMSLVRYSDEVYFKRFIDDTLYRINENGIEPGFVVDYGRHALTREKFLNIPVTGMDRLLDRSYMYGISNPGIVKNHFVFWFNYDGKGFLTVYNRTDRHVFTIAAYYLLKDDLFSDGADIRSIANYWEEHFIGLIHPDRMKSLNPIRFKDVEYKIAADDNPVLFLYDFKK